MDGNTKKNSAVARIRNVVANNGTIGFNTAKELCLFLALVSQVNPYDTKEDMSGIISFEDMLNLVREDTGKRSGSRYERILQFIERIKKGNYIDFPSGLKLDNKPLPKSVFIFEELGPIELPKGNLMYKFSFNEKMRPFIVGLKEKFVQLQIPSNMKSGHAVRFYMMSKSYHDKMRMHQNVTKMIVDVDELKRILKIEGKYSIFADFRKRVIEVIVSEINESGLLFVQNYEFIRESRKIAKIAFYFKDGELYKYKKKDSSTLPNQKIIDFDKALGRQEPVSNIDFVPSKKDIAKLSRAKLRAYHYLIERKCKEGIVYRQILAKMPSSEYVGWEDVFVKKAWERFEAKTKYKQATQKAGAFIKWWGSGEFKDRLFSVVMEDVQAVKKATSTEVWDNRKKATNMTATDFEAWYKKQRDKQVLSQDNKKSQKDSKDGTQSLGDIFKKRIS